MVKVKALRYLDVRALGDEIAQVRAFRQLRGDFGDRVAANVDAKNR